MTVTNLLSFVICISCMIIVGRLWSNRCSEEEFYRQTIPNYVSKPTMERRLRWTFVFSCLMTAINIVCTACEWFA